MIDAHLDLNLSTGFDSPVERTSPPRPDHSLPCEFCKFFSSVWRNARINGHHAMPFQKAWKAQATPKN
jgi:hypothetical protein